MAWRGRGLIYAPPYDGSWKHQFSMLPTPHLRQNGDLRIFLGFCDPKMVGRVGYIDVRSEDPSKILSISKYPVLEIGVPGAFDDNGVVPISLVRSGDELRLYYIGFQLGVKIPYFMFCGLAASTDDGDSFKRVSKSPILDRNDFELYARCGCHVMWDEGLWRMWYVGSVKEGWCQIGKKSVPLYNIRHVQSEDGINWFPSIGTTCIDFANSDEHGFGRPFVRKVDSHYEMILSVRTYSRGYYLSQALSKDGLVWERSNEILNVVRPENSSWDSRNSSYAHTYQHLGQQFLLYNGNGCGKSGVGFAEWISS